MTSALKMVVRHPSFFTGEVLYEVIPGVKKQFDTVSYLLNREDVDTIYICTDSGREG